jgi:hypothetical protein
MFGFSSVRGFVRKYDKSGKLLWTVADFEDQVGPVGLFKHMCIVVVYTVLAEKTYMYTVKKVLVFPIPSRDVTNSPWPEII